MNTTGNIVVIEGELSLTSSICGEIDLSSVICGEIDKVVFVDTVTRPHYEGPYIVTPLVNDPVLLETNGKMMDDDVTVLKVPYSETANPSGGNTAYIGENVNG